MLIAWIVSIFTGRVPDGLRNFIAMFLRYLTHVYAYLFIAANPYPGFTGEPGYPIDVEIAPGEKMSRLTIFFRLFLAIPALIVLWVLGYVAQIVAFFAWFWALFAGKLHPGLRDVLAYYLRYNAQVFGYLALLTQRYPSFSDDLAQRAGRTMSPSSSKPKPGLCAISHACPSRSRNAPA